VCTEVRTPCGLAYGASFCLREVSVLGSSSRNVLALGAWMHAVCCRGLQGQIQKIFEGSSFGGRSPPASKRCSLGGSGCMPPKKVFGNMDALRCNLAHSWVETELLLDSPLVISLATETASTMVCIVHVCLMPHAGKAHSQLRVQSTATSLS